MGKSYTLDHLLGTSFGGFALQEGIWMSMTPTKDSLVVSLEFEGISSINTRERN